MNAANSRSGNEDSGKAGLDWKKHRAVLLATACPANKKNSQDIQKSWVQNKLIHK